MSYTLHLGDCLDILPTLEAQSVDAVIADPPYGTTACKWDSVIPFDAMWRELKRVIKPRGAIVLFGSQPFTSALVMSNVKWFKYELVWNKGRGFEPQLANVRPMKAHENIIVFADGSTVYNPQKTVLDMPDARKASGRKNNRKDGTGLTILASINSQDKTYTDRYPLSVMYFDNSNQAAKLHPSQKSVDLLEYLVKTYTDPGAVVLDFTMGSGTTGEACINTGRSFIGIERDQAYYDIASKRLDAAAARMVQTTLEGVA